MLGHIVHGAYEFVEKTAGEAPGADPEVGRGFVWVGAGIGAFAFGSQMLDIVGSATEEDVTNVVISGALGGVTGACVGMLVWMVLLFALATIKRSKRT